MSEQPIWKCAGCAHPPHGICLAGQGEVCRCLGQPEHDVVCQHGTASDVHCCNCHSGFLFDHTQCVCGSTPDRREEHTPPVAAQGSERVRHAKLLKAYSRACPAESDGGPGIEDSLDAGAEALLELAQQVEVIARLVQERDTLARRVSDLRGEVQGHDCRYGEASGDSVHCRPGYPCTVCQVAALARRVAELEQRARDVLVWLPDNLPSNELYAAVDNLAALIPPTPPVTGGPHE